MTATTATTKKTAQKTAQKTKNAAPAPMVVTPTITVPQPALKLALATVGAAVPSRSSLPVLEHVLVTIEEGVIRLQATNLELGITLRLPAQTAGAAGLTIPFKLLKDVVSALPTEEVTLAFDLERCATTIRCAGFTSTVKGVDADEIPPIPTAADRDPLVEMPAADLARAIQQVVGATDPDNDREVLGSVRMRVGDGITLDASDSTQLARAILDLDTPVATHEAIIPSRTLQRVAGVLKTEETVGLVVQDNQVVFQVGATEVVTRLVAEAFPNLDRILSSIPNATTSITVDTGQLRSALKIAAFFAGDTNRTTVVSFRSGGDEGQPGSLDVRTTTPDRGDHHGAITAAIEGADDQVALNNRMLSEALMALDSDRGRILVAGPRQPVMIQPVGSGQALRVLMPLQIR